MPAPVILRLIYQDGTQEEYRMPVHMAKKQQNNKQAIQSEQPLLRVELDPFLETADANLDNNQFPQGIQEQLFEVVPNKDPPQNLMQKAKKENEEENDEE